MSKPNLPPIPQMDVGVSGQVKFAYSQEALTAYAEEAVRQALAASAKEALHPKPIQYSPDDVPERALWKDGWNDCVRHAEQLRAALATPEPRDG